MSKKLLILHHSHNDIEYADVEAQLIDWQVDFIKQALDIIDEYPSFRWNCKLF